MKVTNLLFDKEKFNSLIKKAGNVIPALKESFAECYCINVYEYSTVDSCTFYCKTINDIEYTISVEVFDKKAE